MSRDRSRSPGLAKRFRSKDRVSYRDAPYKRDRPAYQQDYLCNKCRRPGYFARDCPNAIVYNNCGLPDHLAAECTSTTMCSICKESAHQPLVCHMCGKVADCTNYKACKNCQKIGHLAHECKNDPICNICSISGHVARQCPKSNLPSLSCHVKSRESNFLGVVGSSLREDPFRDMVCRNCGLSGPISRDCLDVVRIDRALVYYENKVNQTKLWVVLAIYTWVDDAIGYLQGMNDICYSMVADLKLLKEETYKFESRYMDNLDLKTRFAHFDNLIENYTKRERACALVQILSLYKFEHKNWEVETNSTSTTPIVDKIKNMKKLIINRKVTLVDDDGKPLKRVDYPGDHDSEDEVQSVDNDMARSMASERVGFGTKSFLKQRRDSYENGDYDEDPYDDDIYEGQDFPDKIQDICDNLDIRVRGRKKK
ncbi:zinc finger protein GIS2-like protein [Tanacetum coccineum]|uniref:Zinc finger protein GIS2-like protein n=1 Tax=Tanacetum coccineum TaxID=301880 RepID=A0ABQ5DNX0_9ASTR